MLHDEESTLSDLENKWTSVEVQTSWKLEPCFQPVTSQNPVVTDVAVVSGDASTLVLDNEVSDMAVSYTHRSQCFPSVRYGDSESPTE